MKSTVPRTTVKVTFDKASVKADGTTYALNLGGGTQVLESHLHMLRRHDRDSRKSYFSGSEALADQIVWLWTTRIGKAFGADGQQGIL